MDISLRVELDFPRVHYTNTLKLEVMNVVIMESIRMINTSQNCADWNMFYLLKSEDTTYNPYDPSVSKESLMPHPLSCSAKSPMNS